MCENCDYQEICGRIEKTLGSLGDCVSFKERKV